MQHRAPFFDTLRGVPPGSVSTGPVSVETFDAKEVAIRLGSALNHGRGIERFLLERQEIYPVFTMLESERTPVALGADLTP